MYNDDDDDDGNVRILLRIDQYIYTPAVDCVLDQRVLLGIALPRRAYFTYSLLFSFRGMQEDSVKTYETTINVPV